MRLRFIALIVALLGWGLLVTWAQDSGELETLLQDLEPVSTEAAPAWEETTELAPAEEVTTETWGLPAEEAVPTEEAVLPAEEAPEAVPEAAPAEEAAVPEEAVGVEVAPEAAWEALEQPPVVEEEMPEVPAEPTILSEPTSIWPEAMPEEAVTEEEAPPEMPEEAPKVVEPPQKPVKKLTAKEARRLAEQEEVKRQALQLEGERQLGVGYDALQERNYGAAAKAFETALAKLPDRPQNVELRERARWGLAEAYYQLALSAFRDGDLKSARENVEKALNTQPQHRPATVLLSKVEKAEALAALPKPVAKRPEVVEKAKTIAELLNEGRQYFEIEDYDRAEQTFERVLVRDEYNVEAMRYLRKIDERRIKRATTQREATVAGMLQQVREAWNPPIRPDVVEPERAVARETVVDKTAQQKLQEKLASIIIPSLEFRQANIHDVVKFLVDASIAGDPAGVGVNILLNLEMPEEAPRAPAAPAAPPPADEWEALFQEAAPAAVPEVAPTAPGVRTITLSLRHVSLLDAIKYITEVANLKFRIEDNVVIITPAGVVTGRVITRMYPVQPSILDVITEKQEVPEERTGEFIALGAARTTIKRGDVKEFFERAGVPFPAGTSITYNPAISQLIVANTAENLDTFERILAQLNVIPTQVEIEARFVEVNQTELEQLGLEWLLTDNWEIAQRKGNAPLAGAERIQINKDNQGFTKGLRFFGFDNTTGAEDPVSRVTMNPNQSFLGNILSVAGVLTNPELTVILQALSQKGHSDLLSAPRVTTRSGVKAEIQVVKEIIYPTEFDSEVITIERETAGGGTYEERFVTTTPGAFVTREVGVILNVTPTVGPDGYTIDLTLSPEVAELVGWIDYGSTIGDVGKYNIRQPIFSSRNVTTSLVIWDGQTVVMGGLIREELVSVKDKVPFLGDLPIVGRLFRSEGQKSNKKNLLIFVTARLVDPAGRPLHRPETRPLGGAVATEAAATAMR